MGSSATSLARVVLAILQSKAVAVFAGPAALAVLGQLSHVLNLAAIAVNAVGGPSLLRALGDANGRADRRRAFELTSTSGLAALALGLAASLSALLCADPIAVAVLGSGGYAPMIRVVSVALFAACLTSYLGILLVAHRAMPTYLGIQAIGAAILETTVTPFTSAMPRMI